MSKALSAKPSELSKEGQIYLTEEALRIEICLELYVL
jgi:hypothetical protein